VGVQDKVHHQIKKRNQVKVLHNYEGVKDFVVVVTNTVVDPRAMVIKSFHTLVTLIAVPTSWGFEHLAVWAKQH